jgi:hypothetical protein
MNDTENRKRQMFSRVDGFGVEHANDFAANSIGKQLFTALRGIIAELDGHASSEVSGRGFARQGTTTRAAARHALTEDLQAIRRTARAMADDVTGLDDKFRMPPDQNDQLLLNAARAFATDAAPLSAQFIAHELPADFLADLDAGIAALEQAIDNQSSGVGDHVAAGAAIDDAINRGMITVRKLDAIVRNKYADDRAVLAEWTSASHTERAPHHSAPSPQPPPPTPSA